MQQFKVRKDTSQFLKHFSSSLTVLSLSLSFFFLFHDEKNVKRLSCNVQDIHFGEKFSREWSDSGEEPMKEGALHGPKGLAGQLMRKHDSEAGRRAIRSRMQRVCKCHGE